MNGLVSIVFTSYNHAEYLEQAVESILRQTYPSIELIIVDDCSTDGSQDILRRYAEHPIVSLKLREKNSGSYVKASNYGAAFARGEYLLFAQCDDFSEPDQVESLVRAARRNPGAGVVFSKSLLVDATGQVLSDDLRGRERKFREQCTGGAVVTGNEMRSFLFYSCVIPNLSAALIERKLYSEKAMLSEEYIMAADWAMWLEMAERTDFYYVDKPLNNFRQHETTIRSRVKMTRQVAEIYRILYGHARRYPLSRTEKEIMRRGAGAVWFWYFVSSPWIWLKGFVPLFRETLGYETFNVWYMVLGGIKVITEHFGRPGIAKV